MRAKTRLIVLLWTCYHLGATPALAEKHPRFDFNTSLDDSNGKITEKEYREILSVVFAVDDLVNGALKIPSRLGLKITPEAENAAYNHQTNFLTIPMVLSKQNSPPQKKELYFASLVAHEYAHKLLELNVGQQLRQKMKTLLEQSKASGDPHATNQARQKIRRASDILGGLHELFADTIAVLLTNDLSVMRDSLFDLLRRRGHSDWAVARDFAIRHVAEDWMKEDAHHFYSPVRGFLGEQKINLLSQPAKRELIREMISEVENEVSSALLNDQEKGHSQLNKSLQASLERRLARVFSGPRLRIPKPFSTRGYDCEVIKHLNAPDPGWEAEGWDE